MRKYPIEEAEAIIQELQQILARYRTEQNAEVHKFTDPENRGNRLSDISTNYMNEIDIKIRPKLDKILGKFEALLSAEDPIVVARIKPIINELSFIVTYPTNLLGYVDISSKLMKLVGNLTIEITMKPIIFVGHRYTDEDIKIANKFIDLFTLEGLDIVSGRSPKPMEVDDKVKNMITEADGVIIIFSRDMKLDNSQFWTTSGWLNGELTFAMAKEKPYLIFYDECINPDERKGIQGEYEYVEFNRECLDYSFLKAIPYIREFKSKILGSV